MREKNIIIIVCIFLTFLSFAIVYFSQDNTGFNFYKSEITINENRITEKLFYSPDKPYHTLYRSFLDPVDVQNQADNGISISSVSCSDGTPYVYSFFGNFWIFENGLPEKSEVLPYTTFNEYGCTFGDYLGFAEKEEYIVEATYTISAENIFMINEKPYIKFVAYSPKNHVKLKVGENLLIKGEAEYSSLHHPKDSAVIYIPFDGDIESKNVIKLDRFVYDDQASYWWTAYLWALVPSLILFLIWYFFGKEKFEPDTLESSSIIPSKIKPWEVAAYFHPPFSVLDKEFISSLVLDLYKRKIINIKIEQGFLKKNCYVKILNEQTDDAIENLFLDIIKFVSEDYKGKYSAEGYVNLANPGFFKRRELVSKFRAMQKRVESIGKKYQDTKGKNILTVFGMFVLLYIVFFWKENYFLMAFSIIYFITVVYITNNTGLFVKYKGDYYREFLEWQAFRNYLKGAPSLKLHGHKGVIVWGEYLTYAAALGVSDRVIKELREQGIISSKDYGTYISANNFSTSVIASGVMGSASGHGGAGAGGVGGGGGGGR